MTPPLTQAPKRALSIHPTQPDYVSNFLSLLRPAPPHTASPQFASALLVNLPPLSF